MAMPNFNPEDHGEEITAASAARRAHEADVLAAMTADLEGTPAAKLAQQLVPVVPDGGAIGRQLTPHVKKAAKTRDRLRIWAPAIGATGAFGVAVVVLPVTGPLAVYGIGLVGFGWWHSAGRPGPVESIQMLFYTGADALARIRAWVARLTARRAAHEDRRTSRKEEPSTD
ncbi:hypothetical protein [Nocardia carnea]|uniref:hypothetical protein n=1 Tax=Nocardia carnea TaxID=37328 RepID=UPI00245455B9|nr:hypothetical protein [Nocardia carnea]